MRASLLLALVLSFLGLVTPSASAGVPAGPPSPVLEESYSVHVEGQGVALWRADERGLQVLVAEDLRIREHLDRRAGVVDRETHVRRIALLLAEAPPALSPLAAEPRSGWVVYGYDLTESGRFLQNDPILGNRASEGYAYASGNPLSFTDPFGLDDEPGFLKRWWFGSWGATKNFGAFIRTGTWDWWTMSFNDDARMRIYAARANLAKSIDEHGALQALFIDSTIGEITAGADDYARGNYEQGMARATTGGTNGVFLVRGAVSGIRGGIRFVQGARANGFLATVRSSAGGFRAWATTPDASFKGNLGFDPADPFGFGRAFGQGFEEGAQDFARESTPPETVYRGVNAKHPFVDWAQQGYAVPKGQFKPDAHTSPGLHSDGNTESIFTSWTTDPKVAAWFAMKEGPGGVILIDRIPAGSGIRGGMIPAESEVIRQGIIGPVQVIMPEPLNVLSDDPAPASWQAR